MIEGVKVRRESVEIRGREEKMATELKLGKRVNEEKSKNEGNRRKKRKKGKEGEGSRGYTKT